MNIQPESSIVTLEGSVNLNCTIACTNYTRIGWEVSVNHVTHEGHGWISLSIANVTENELQPICFAYYGDSKPTATKASIYVYRKSSEGYGDRRYTGVLKPIPSPPRFPV